MKEKTGKLGIGKEVTVALITALSTILAAVISGIFLLYITNSTVRSNTDIAKNVSVVTPTVTAVTSFYPSNPSSASTPSTPTKNTSGVTSTLNTPTTTPARALLQVYPASVNFSSCLPTEQRRIALNITNTSPNQLSWSITASSAYTYSLLDHTGNQITTSGFSPNMNVSIASKQTQTVLISNIQGSGTLSVKSPQSASQTVAVSCATSTSQLGIAPQAVTFDSCSSLNYRTFAFSVINNSANALSWRLTNPSALNGISSFATEDSSQPGGQIQGKSTAIVLVYNVQSSMTLQLSDSTSASYTINVTCG